MLETILNKNHFFLQNACSPLSCEEQEREKKLDQITGYLSRVQQSWSALSF